MMGHGKIIFFNEILYMLLNNWGKKVNLVSPILPLTKLKQAVQTKKIHKKRSKNGTCWAALWVQDL